MASALHLAAATDTPTAARLVTTTHRPAAIPALTAQ